jgi:hypothetical protein
MGVPSGLPPLNRGVVRGAPLGTTCLFLLSKHCPRKFGPRFILKAETYGQEDRLGTGPI